jgi:phosphatidylinositol glycan class B
MRGGLIGLVLARGGLDDREWRSFLLRWLGTSLLLIGVAAFQSDGYHHPDEYFQTLEFAGAKLGRTPTQELPWEYSYRIRPWLQPGLYFVLARVLGAIGVSDPFTWALGCRLISGLLGWLAIVGLACCCYRWFPQAAGRRAAVIALCLAWFVPYLAVRTSSESLAGSCFVLGVGLLVLTSTDGSRACDPHSRLALASVGILFGLAFEFRYAVAVAVVAVVAWATAVARVPVRRMVWLAAGLLLALGLATCVDRWGYGSWVFPAYEYLLRNLVEDRAALRFGALPWYGYFVLAVSGLSAPLLSILLIATLLGWARRPLHCLTWATAPFFVVHCLISHKEMRLLFPVAVLTPVLAVLALAALGDRRDRWPGALWQARRYPLRAFIALDLIALAALCLTPTRPQLGFQRFVRHQYPTRFEAYLLTPFSPWEAERLSMHLYRPQTLTLHQASFAEVEAQRPQRCLLITGSFDRTALPERSYSCRLLYRSLPSWLRDVPGLRIDRVPAWNLYECVRREPPSIS